MIILKAVGIRWVRSRNHLGRHPRALEYGQVRGGIKIILQRREARSGVLRASLCTAAHELRTGRALVDARESVPTNNVVTAYGGVTTTT